MEDESGDSGKLPLLWIAVVFEFSLALIAVLLGWMLGINPFRNLAWSSLQQLGHALLVGAIAAIPPLAVFQWARRSQWGVCRNLRQLLDEHLMEHLVEATTLHLAWVALAAGFGEEVLFRGCLQQAFATFLDPGVLNGYLPLILASLLFGLAHFASWTYFVMATIVGLYLGGLMLATGSLWPAVVAHALYDFVAIVALQRDYKKKRAT